MIFMFLYCVLLYFVGLKIAEYYGLAVSTIFLVVGIVLLFCVCLEVFCGFR